MKRLIVFALWGNMIIYCIGAIKNAILAKKYFPEWICRYYYDNTVPEIIINYLKSLDNTELVFIEKPSGSNGWKVCGQFGMLWKFYPFNDDDVEIWLSRDTDSRISPYEKEVIDDFITSDKIIHSFRRHDEPLLRGGMIAFKNYNKTIDTRIFNNIKLDIHQLMSDINQANTPFYTDEIFLQKKILPLYKEKYSWNPRIYNIKVPYYCGQYVGSVIDEYDKPCDKNKYSFNIINETAISDYIKKYINKIF